MGSKVLTEIARLDSWQVKSHSDLLACEALQTSAMYECWSIFCATFGGRPDRRASDFAAEHISHHDHGKAQYSQI